MKIKKIILSLLFLISSVIFTNAQDNIFYYDKSGEKIYLQNENKVKFVYFVNAETAKSNQLANQLKDYDIMVEAWNPLAYKISGDFTKKSVINLLLDIQSKNEILYISDMLLYDKTNVLWASDEIIVKIFPETKLSAILDANKIPYREFKRLGSNPQTYVIKLDVSKQSAIEYANMFFEKKLVECAQPSFWKMFEKLNPYFSSQWGLLNTGQYGGRSGIDIKATEAWRFASGQGIKVAVIDEGVDLYHPDLVNNLLKGYDATDGLDRNINGGYTGTVNGGFGGAAIHGGINCLIEDSHGTSCAGIIAASDNDKGIKGVAYNAKIIPIRIAYSRDNMLCLWETRDTWTVDGLHKAWYTYGADILSNSWTWGINNFAIENEIIAAQTQGRGNKGCVVVFGSGNDNRFDLSFPARLSKVIAVGAISPCGERKTPNSCDGERWGSDCGDSLDIVAPGVLIATTDTRGDWGYNPKDPIHINAGGNKISSDFPNQDYSVWFSGTSAACPHVSGVAALILSINPNLNAQEVRNIIESTAQKIRTDKYSYSTTTGRNNGTWNNEMGYGLVDAYTAVKKACTTISVSPINFTNQTITTSTTITNCGDINVQNVKVQNGAKLTLDAAGTVNIIKDFEVVLGSQLEIL